jgi:hypothetical protein
MALRGGTGFKLRFHEKLHDLFLLPNNSQVTKSGRIRILGMHDFGRENMKETRVLARCYYVGS